MEYGDIAQNAWEILHSGVLSDVVDKQVVVQSQTL